MYYTGETDEQVFSHQNNGFETIQYELDPARRACVERLFAAREVILQTEQHMVPLSGDSPVAEEWFRPVHQAAPIEGSPVSLVPENPVHTMSQEVVDHSLSNIERQFSTKDNDMLDLSGLDSAWTTAQLTELMEREQL